MDIIDNVIAAVNAAGIRCDEEYGFGRAEKTFGEVHAYAGIKKLRLERLRGGLSDVTAQVRVTVQAYGASGSAVSEAAEKIVIPAVLGCGEEIYCAEVSETSCDVKTDRVYAEILFDVRRCGYDVCG